jgi:hypothetical protein
VRPEVLAESLALSVKGLLEPIVAALEMERATVAALVARVAELEARAPVPGPMGPAGPAGAEGPAGAAGLAGKDGAPGLQYCGVYVRGKTYDAGEVVTDGGSAFHCQRLTGAAPGSSPDWVLMVKRGRDGKDAGGRG